MQTTIRFKALRLTSRACDGRGLFAEPGKGVARLLGGLATFLLFVIAIAAKGEPASTPQTIKVVADDNYPPYVFRNDRGELEGIAIDQWRLWEKATGIKVKFYAMNWDDALLRMRAGEFDVIDTIFETEARTNYFDFTKAYARIEVCIFFRNGISGIRDLESLKGFAVAAKEGDADVDLLKKKGIGPLLLYQNYESIIEAAKEHKINVFVMDKPPALYFLNKLEIENDFRMSAPISAGEFHRAVRKGNTNLLQQIEGGFAAVGQPALDRVRHDWYGGIVPTIPYLRYTGWGALGFALFAAVLVVWNWTLTRQVRKRTLTLQESESRLRESDERLRSILDGMFAFVGLISSDGILQDCNRTPLTVIGRRKDEIVGRPFAEGEWFTHSKETQEQVRAMIREAAEGKEVRQDIRVRIATGEIRVFDASFCGLRDSSGRITQIVASGVDITQRKKAEATLQENEAKLRETLTQKEQALDRAEALLESAPDPILIVDASGRIILANHQAEKAFGYERHELIHKPVESLIPAELHGEHARLLEGFLNDPKVRPMGAGHELFACRKDGSQFPVNVNLSPLQTPEGWLIISTIRDITDQREANERIRRLNRTYAVLSDINQLIVRKLEAQAVLEGVCRIAKDKGQFLLAWIGMVNPTSHQLKIVAHAGATPETLKIVENVLAGPTPHCLQTRRALQTGVLQVCNDIEHDPETAAWREAALQRGYRSMIALPLLVQGQRAGTLNLYAAEANFFDADELHLLDELAQDIAFALESCEREHERLRALEQKRSSEERFRELAETIEDVFWITEPDKLTTLYVSPAYEKIWGRTCQSLYDDPRSWEESIHPGDRKQVLAAANTRQIEGKYDEEYRIIRPDGTIRWIRDRAFVVRNAAGRVERIVGVARDITERKGTEELLRQSQKMEAIGQLAGGVAHDFNNILAVIRMQAEMMAMSENIAPDEREGLLQIKASAERAADLTRQLLLFSRKQVMQPRDLDLNEVVTSLTKMLQRLIGEDVRLQLNLHPTRLVTRADAGMLDQVLLNLAINARDAMPQGGSLNIETSMKTVDDMMAQVDPDATPGRFVWLSVSDTGTGISHEILPRIFEPFFTTKEPGKGTGLGLATVFGIVKQHGGWIKAYSEPGKGANFQVFLPASTKPAVDSSHQALSPKPRRGAETILLVEDEASVRQLTRIALERHGYRVLEAATGPEALERWSQYRDTVALLLTDLVMPGGMTGQQLARKLQGEQPRLKVIYTSGYSGDIAGRELELRVRENFIQKPASVTQLLETVRRCLDGG